MIKKLQFHHKTFIILFLKKISKYQKMNRNKAQFNQISRRGFVFSLLIIKKININFFFVDSHSLIVKLAC